MAKLPTLYRRRSTEREDELDGVELASFPRRAGSLIFDFVFAGILFLVITVQGGILLQSLGLLDLDQDYNFNFIFFGNWYSVIWLVLYFSLSVYFGNGKTLGKKVFGIRIVSLTHKRISFWHAVERALGYGASTLELGLGFLQFFWSPDRRTVHDRIAETIVIRERKEKTDEG